MDRSTQQPGDFLLDRYFPDADEMTREAAREQLKRFVRALLRVATRLAEEEAAQSGDSPKSPRRPTISSVP
jgi:hypothetical protein